jgi:tetratricopeptide (TPR) repeat protein
VIPSLRALIETALRQLDDEQPAEAERSLRAALAMSPRDDQLLNLLGVALVRQQRDEEAVEPLRKAIALNRREAEYHNALGCALRNAGRVDEGIESLERALKLDPGLHGARFNLAQAFQVRRDFAQAERLFREVLARQPGDIETVNALAAQQWQLGDYEGSLSTLRAGIERSPASGDLRFALGEKLLALGRWEEGWFRYLWRINRHGFLRKVGLPFDSPKLIELLPQRLDGQIVRVHAEQGIGDDLYFLRFCRFLRERGARVEGAVTPRLVDMVRRAGVLDAVEPAPDRIPPDAGYRLLGDLPYLLHAAELPLPGPVRFLPLQPKMAEVAARLAGLERPLVGLTWRAGTGPESGNRNVLYKEARFADFLDMAKALPGTPLVLQRSPKPEEVSALAEACGARLVDLSPLNADLEAMLALLAQIDDYVGVSNTNMHLMAGLGRGARVLVSRLAEFRWMAEGAESPWFPGFRVYRQQADGGWKQTLEEVLRDIAWK